MKLLEIRRVKAYQQETVRQALKQNGNVVSSSFSTCTKIHDSGSNGDSNSPTRKQKISSADRSKASIDKFTTVCKSEYSINIYYTQLKFAF